MTFTLAVVEEFDQKLPEKFDENGNEKLSSKSPKTKKISLVHLHFWVSNQYLSTIYVSLQNNLRAHQPYEGHGWPRMLRSTNGFQASRTVGKSEWVVSCQDQESIVRI